MSNRLLNLARRTAGAFDMLRAGLQPRFDHWAGRAAAIEKEQEERGFAADSDYAILHQEPLRARVLLKSIGIACALFIMWAAVSRVDEVTRGEGKVIPSRQLQVLQSLDGGVVAEILVREGDVVEPDQILLRIIKSN